MASVKSFDEMNYRHVEADLMKDGRGSLRVYPELVSLLLVLSRRIDAIPR